MTLVVGYPLLISLYSKVLVGLASLLGDSLAAILAPERGGSSVQVDGFGCRLLVLMKDISRVEVDGHPESYCASTVPI